MSNLSLVSMSTLKFLLLISITKMSYEHTTEEVDLEKYPNAKALVQVSEKFFKEVEDL